MKQLISGNEAIALGAYHAGIQVAAAYPGTPSTEILENLAKRDDIYAEWSTNEKVAMEVGIGASLAGVRCIVSCKHVGLNVASDPFLSAATVGVNGGLVVISAADPGLHSSQGEQDNRYFAKLAKVPVMEPSDSNDAYEFTYKAFEISEQFDTPVLIIPTTRISHAKTIADISYNRITPKKPEYFKHNVQKYVMLPSHARIRMPLLDERIEKLAEYAETYIYNQVFWGDKKLGIISSGISYQYAREVFPNASHLKLGISFPLPRKLIKEFASKVEKVLVIEELDPFIQESILAMGIKVIGKEYIPKAGEFNLNVIEEAGIKAGLLNQQVPSKSDYKIPALPARPPLLCPGCPHTGIFFTLNTIGRRSKLFDTKGEIHNTSDIIITGDIGCYTLGTYPPLSAIDTSTCMGASIGEAIGLEKSGLPNKIVAVIGDSTFMHSGITGLANAIYNQSKITICILDNGTTAMTGHQGHPGTGISAKGTKTTSVNIENMIKGMGVTDLTIVNSHNLKEIRTAVRAAIDNPELSVIIVRGNCAMRIPKGKHPSKVDADKCDVCGTCLRLGCSAIQKINDKVSIDPNLCLGETCKVCQQICPKKAIYSIE